MEEIDSEAVGCGEEKEVTTGGFGGEEARVTKSPTTAIIAFFGVALLAFIGAVVYLHVTSARQDYFPLKVGYTWTYETVKPAQSLQTFTVSISETEEVDGQQAYVTSASPRGAGQIFYLRDKTVYLYASQNAPGSETRTVYEPPMPIVSYPLRAGKKWTYKGKAISGENSTPIEAEFSVGHQERITTAAGSFKCYPIVRRTENGERTNWLAPRVGTVKMREPFKGEIQGAAIDVVIERELQEYQLG